MNQVDAGPASGATCDYGPCTAPVLIVAEFASGDLHLCRHHWNEAEEIISVAATYLRAHDLTAERTTSG
jgi:hypothetical protein